MKEKNNTKKVDRIYTITGMVYVGVNTWTRINIYPTVYTNIKTATNVATRLKMMSDKERKEATGYIVDNISIRVEKVFVNNHADEKINIIEAPKDDDFTLETKGKPTVMTIDDLGGAWGKITVEFYCDSVKITSNMSSFIASTHKSSSYCMRDNVSDCAYYMSCTDVQKRHLATYNEMLLLQYIEKKLSDKMGMKERYAMPFDGSYCFRYYWIRNNEVFDAHNKEIVKDANLSDRFRAIFIQYVK